MENVWLNVVFAYKSEFILCNKKQATDYFIMSSCIVTGVSLLNCFYFSFILYIRHTELYEIMYVSHLINKLLFMTGKWVLQSSYKKGHWA